MDRRRRALLAAFLGALMENAQARDAIERAIPSSGEKIPLIGLGTWQTFDVGNDAAERARLGEVLKLLDGHMVDSSPMYGTSEAVTGDLLAELGLRSRVFVATKVWTHGRSAGVRQIEQSFRRLRVERIDLMQVHNLLDVATHSGTLRELKRQGRIRYAGITHYTASAYDEVERELQREPWDFLQINYSLAEREAEKRILPLARERGVAVIANRPFGTGSLFRRARGKSLPPWAGELGIESWAQFFLKWIVSHPVITCAIPATSKPEHMRDNLGAGRGPLPDEAARRRMAAHFESL